MNPPIIEALSDSFPLISKTSVQPLSSPRTVNNFSFAKNNELQSNLLTNTNCLVNQEPKILLDSRQTYKKEMNSPSRTYESDLKKNSQKTIFKDTAKGILIRKTGNLRLPIASLETSPISSIRNSDYSSPFQFEKDTVIASAIAKKSERFFPKVDENELNETKSSNNLTSIIGLRSPRKVTFSNDTADKEDKMESLGLRNYKSTPFSNATNPNRGLTINLKEKSPKLNRREQDNLHRGPRLISEALLSGAPDHMLFKEGKSLTCETLTNNNIYFIEDEEFMVKQEEIENYKKLRIPPLFSREEPLRLPLIASARGSKGTIFDLSPQIKTERADFGKLSKKENLENMAENNENYAESPSRPFKGHLRKTASFTVGRNKTKRIYKFPEN